MSKFLSFWASLLLSVNLCAYASDGSTPIIVFLNGSTTGSQIVYAKNTNYTSPDVAYDFTPTNGDTIPSHYSQSGSSYIYSYVPPTPPVVPNIAGFITACRTDSTFTSEIRIGLAGLLGLLQMDAGNPTAAQQDWQDAIATYGGSWLTSDVQTKIEGYASTYNIPIQ